jgi:acetyltransferase-like isoleucine patch superfamily enzyme
VSQLQFEAVESPVQEAYRRWPAVNRGTIEADEVQLGVGVVIEPGVFIRAEKVVIRDFAYIGPSVRIIVPEFTLGDYTRINEGSFLGGTKPMRIGRNGYFGKSVQLDSRGGLTIGDHVGVGSLSQIWTHIRHGDTVQGCRWDKEYALTIEDDVWLVARVTVGGAQHIGARAMVFNESNVTRNLRQDRTYAGNPVVDVTEKMGPQFEPLTPLEKLARLDVEIFKFEHEHPEYAGQLTACLDAGAFALEPNKDTTCFEVTTRTYTKRYTQAEVTFLKSTLAKFIPAGAQ